MSHPEQLAFFGVCAAANAGLISDARVLEIGSYDVNGSVRRLFAASKEYVGIDLVAGPGVDRVANGSSLMDPDGSWDVALSGECFEHDPMWRQTLQTMVRVTRPGGLVAFTCASRGRVEHGTVRTAIGDSPGTQFHGVDYYRNVSKRDVTALPLADWFSEWTLHYAPMAADLYFAGVRAGTPDGGRPTANLPQAETVQGLRYLMGGRDRVLRAPLRPLSLVVSREDWFQSIATRYWRVANASIVQGGALKNRLMGR